MKIETGKYYKNRAGEVIGPMEDNFDDVYPFICVDGRYRSYMVDGTFHADSVGDDDLVEECNADGSPIVEPSVEHKATYTLTREEVALKMLPTVYLTFHKYACERGCPDNWRTSICQDAFLLADEFIKVANQK